MSDHGLAEFVEMLVPESRLRVESDLGDGFVRLRVDEAEKRQAKQDIRHVEDAVIELLRNARDAQAGTLYLATTRDGDIRRITLVDDGAGIPHHMHEMVFEPRVTSKLDTFHEDKWGVHGRGMALYSIKANSVHCEVAASSPGKGTSISVSFNTRDIGEKADQSTFPVFERGEGNKAKITGPHNILRETCEFALEHRRMLRVFVGSPSQIAATMYDVGIRELSYRERLQEVDLADVPLVKRLAYCSDEQEFAEACEGIGLGMSERTALRVLNGEIEPIDDLATVVRHVMSLKTLPPMATRAKNPTQGGTPLIRLDEEDVGDLETGFRHAFARFAEKYYLDGDVVPTVRIAKGQLVVSYELREQGSQK